MAKPIVVIGATGQLGTDLMRLWPKGSEAEILGLNHGDIEVTDYDAVHRKLSLMQPRLVINTAAYHKVDALEDNPEKAFAVNAIGPRNLSFSCRELDAVFIHLSTDYVFSGNKRKPYRESDPVDPVNVYGISKSAGEMFVRSIWRKHFIVRCSGLYGAAGPSGKGTNFVELMLRLAQQDKPVKVVDDQVLTPTPTSLLAKQIAILSGTDRYGTYHATCRGSCSWYEFARKIFEFSGLKPDLKTQTTAQSGTRATRPPYSVLENENLKKLGIDAMPAWQAGLEEYLDAKG
ncbi:MAG: dTDP-4-dehydrorhamnose reductase [Acidobacteria bacterium]|nr:dTDP-4-dehydrorhamnose reductase [Acidobacteriota bacterium]